MFLTDNTDHKVVEILKPYLTQEGKLNYHLLYQDLAEMRGFNAKDRRERHYKEVTDAYEQYRTIEEDSI